MGVAFMPWAGYVSSEDTIKLSSYFVIGLAIFCILFLMVYLNNNLRRKEATIVKGEQGLQTKLRYLAKPVGPGRKIETQVEVQKRDRWDDGTCKQYFVKELCTTCAHHRRRYYGNFCKHFGMVVDRPAKMAA